MLCDINAILGNINAFIVSCSTCGFDFGGGLGMVSL